jgi:hypothetical protein
MNSKNLTDIFLLFQLIAFSCDKAVEPLVLKTIETRHVEISWKGNHNVDGCGFFIFIDQVRHKAVNEEIIGTEFMVDSLVSAEIYYEYLGKKKLLLCGDSPAPEEIYAIKIYSIVKLE